MTPNARIALALATLAAPLVFIWTLELAVQAPEIRDTTLIVFVWPVNALPMYHLALYALLATTTYAAAVLLRTADPPCS